jgi:flagellar motor switch protein FliN
MTDDLQFAPLEPAPAVATPPAEVDLERLTDVTVELAVQIGRTRMTLGGALSLGPGSIVTLDRAADQPVDLLVNGKPIARGEVVVVDESFGLRITEVVGAAPRAEQPQPTRAAAPPVGELPPVAEAA